MISQQMTAAESRVLRADAARVQGQHAEQKPATPVATKHPKRVAA